MPAFSVIIPTLREEQFIDATLKQFGALTIPHELIVSDGGSKDQTLPIINRYTQKVFVWEGDRRQTFGEAKNAGATLATGEFFVFIDADVHIPHIEQFFETMLAIFHKHPELVAATVPLLPWEDNKSWVDYLFCAPLNWFYIISNNIFHSGNSSGEFQMVRASAFRQLGGFREKLAAGEDNELFRNLADIGRTRSVSSLCVRHSLRRPHKLGWLRTYGIWIRNGFSVMLFNKSAYKEWKVVR